jgi:hypothetical protein
VCDIRAKGRKYRASVRAEEVVGAAREVITRSTRKCVRHLAQQIEIGVSTRRAWKNCRDDLLLFPYKMQLSQPLSEDGIARRHAVAREYGALLEETPGVLNVT